MKNTALLHFNFILYLWNFSKAKIINVMHSSYFCESSLFPRMNLYIKTQITTKYKTLTSAMHCIIAVWSIAWYIGHHCGLWEVHPWIQIVNNNVFFIRIKISLVPLNSMLFSIPSCEGNCRDHCSLLWYFAYFATMAFLWPN